MLHVRRTSRGALRSDKDDVKNAVSIFSCLLECQIPRCYAAERAGLPQGRASTMPSFGNRLEIVVL